MGLVLVVTSLVTSYSVFATPAHAARAEIMCPVLPDMNEYTFHSGFAFS